MTPRAAGMDRGRHPDPSTGVCDRDLPQSDRHCPILLPATVFG